MDVTLTLTVNGSVGLGDIVCDGFRSARAEQPPEVTLKATRQAHRAPYMKEPHRCRAHMCL